MEQFLYLALMVRVDRLFTLATGGGAAWEGRPTIVFVYFKPVLGFGILHSSSSP
jgi:hypothetical protein